jgi:Protein of unknown function (DUF3429)
MAEPENALLASLPFAGAIPFAAGALLQAFGVASLPLLGSVEALVLTYGLAILSFMAGVHWGQFLSGVRSQMNLLVFSNVLTVAAWLCHAMLPSAVFAIILAGLFGMLLLVDCKLAAEGVLTKDYLRTRASVTALVAASLAVTAWFAA